MARDAAVTISLWGAADSVTGSKFLLSYGHNKVLLEAGLFQGPRELRQRNWDELPVAAENIDAVVISHAHLDHCGFLPRLWKLGFRGPIYLTPDTANLASIVLRDSAKLQEEDAEYATRKGYSRHAVPQPLYGSKDAEGAISLFRTVNFGNWHPLPGSGRLRFLPAGHILGGAIVDLDLAGARVLHSGDLGRGDHPLLVGPHEIPAEHYDAVVVESTYGDRKHPEKDDSLERAIARTVGRGGTVLIPAFAVDRTELILDVIRDAMVAGAIPSVPVYMDSPMAVDALQVYRHAIEANHSEIRPELREDAQAVKSFEPETLRTLRTPSQSKSINDAPPCIIISASGMATGGRVLHHLKRLLPDPKNTVVLAGYQAVGTRGRDLREGAREIKIHGQLIPVEAEICDVEYFSVHADRDDILRWLASAPHTPSKIFIVHGEQEARNELARAISGQLSTEVVVPQYRDSVRIADR